MAYQVDGLKPRQDVPTGDTASHRNWAEFWGLEVLASIRRVLDGSTTNEKLELQHIKRASQCAFGHAARLIKHRKDHDTT